MANLGINVSLADFAYEEHRNIFIQPPDDVRDILKLSQGQSSDLARQKMVSAFSICNTDSHPANWIRCRDLTGIHVDEMLGAGGDVVKQRTILDVKRELDSGAWDIGVMKLEGRQLTQMAIHEIMVDMKHYRHEPSRVKFRKKKN